MLFSRFKTMVGLSVCFVVLLTNLSGCTQKKALPINDIIATELIDKGIENSKIISFCDNTSKLGSLHSYNPINITEDEISEYVDGVLPPYEQLVETKEKLLNEKKRESIEKTDNAFLDRVAEDCRFEIDKREAAEYSEKIVEEYKNLAYVNGFEFEDYLRTELNTSKDEFYDFCYDEGVKEIKRYLLIGAVSYDMPSYEYSFANFCSMSGYDSTKTDEYEGVFAWTIYYYAQNHSDGSKGGLVGLAPQNYDFEYTVRIYNSTSVDCIDLSGDGDYTLNQETQEDLIKTLQTLSPKTIKFDTCNHIYDTVVVFTDSQTGTDTVLMIDGKNSFVKYKSKNKLVYSDYSDDFAKIINSVKQG